MPDPQHIRPRCHPATVASITVAAIVVAAWALARWPGDHHWLTTPLTYSPQLVWLIGPAVTLGWAAATRCGYPAIFSTTVLIFALLGPAGVVVGPAGPPADTDIRIASQNLFSKIERADQFALESWRRCDIVCLQETAEDGYTGLLPGYEQCRSGELRTFVRGSIVRSEAVEPDAADLPPALACEVKVRGHRLMVLNCHLEMAQPQMNIPYLRRLWPDYLRHTVAVREAQFNAWERWAEAQALPVIIAGDFNTPPASRFYRRMRWGLTDCFAAAGAGGGYTWVPHGIPIFRIDYIWAGPQLEPIECQVGRSGPSDHRLITATLRPSQ